MRQVLIYPGEDGWWVAEVPSLPGVVAQGKTKAEVIAQVREAITLYVETLEAHGEPVPEDHLDALLVAV